MDPTGTGAERRRSRRVIPFWILQAAGLLAFVALADLSLHVGHGGTLVGVGTVYAGLALTADGPLGLVRLFSRPVHAHLVVAASVVAAVAPLVPALRPDIEGTIILVVVAVGMLRLATLTSTAAPRPRTVAVDGPVIEATARPATASPATARPSASAPRVTGPAGVGGHAPATAATDAAARWAGRATAAAATAAAQHRPAAEDQVRRALRRAGRLTGKATSDRRRNEPGASGPR